MVNGEVLILMHTILCIFFRFYRLGKIYYIFFTQKGDGEFNHHLLDYNSRSS